VIESRVFPDADPGWALGQRWTHDAKKLAASTRVDHQPELDRPTMGSTVDDDLVMAPPGPDEPAATRSAPELTAGRDVTDGFSSDLAARRDAAGIGGSSRSHQFPLRGRSSFASRRLGVG